MINRKLDLDVIVAQLGIDLESFEKWKASENLLPQPAALTCSMIIIKDWENEPPQHHS